jgi:hypothetical protein
MIDIQFISPLNVLCVLWLKHHFNVQIFAHKSWPMSPGHGLNPRGLNTQLFVCGENNGLSKLCLIVLKIWVQIKQFISKAFS